MVQNTNTSHLYKFIKKLEVRNCDWQLGKEGLHILIFKVQK